MRAISLLAAAAMVVSLFLPWLATPVPGAGTTPWALVRGIGPDMDAIREFLSVAPPLLLAFLASFALAALFLLLAVVGLPLRLLALAAGGLAVATVAWGYWRLREGALDIGLPLPASPDPGQLLDLARASLAPGAWAWAAGALVLLLAGIAGFGRD